MSTDRQALIVKLREREQDLRAACEYVGGGVKGVIFAEVAENTRDAADALEQAETELSSLREREGRFKTAYERAMKERKPGSILDHRAAYETGLLDGVIVCYEQLQVDPSPADPKGQS